MGYEGLEFKCYCRSKRYTEEFEGKQCEMCLSKIIRRNSPLPTFYSPEHEEEE